MLSDTALWRQDCDMRPAVAAFSWSSNRAAETRSKRSIARTRSLQQVFGNAFRLRDLYGAKAEVAALLPILLQLLSDAEGAPGFAFRAFGFQAIRADPRAVQAATHLAVRQ